MGATFSRIKTWIAGETLTASDLNAEFNQIYNNLDPTGIDDESANDAAAQATSDPYAGSSLVKATSLEGELQQLRYLIAQITGETYWYIDPDNDIATIHAALIEAGTIMLFGQTAAPTGWTKKTNWQDNAMLCYATGTPGSGGSVNPQSTHLHSTSAHTLTTTEMPAHTHGITGYNGTLDLGAYVARACYENSGATQGTASAGSGGAHNHGNTGASTAPYYQEVIAATKD